MKHVLWITGGFLIWAMATYGVLQVGLTADTAHAHSGLSICGPWGCGPPLKALIGWHGFVLMLTLAPTALLVAYGPRSYWRRVGAGLLAAGLLAVGGICVYEAVTWLPRIPAGEPTYLVRRCLFSLATATDVPGLQLSLVGGALWLAGRTRP